MSMLLRHLRRDTFNIWQGHQSLRFSSSLSKNQPYLILGGDYSGVNFKGDNVGNIKYYDPCKGDVKISKRTVAMESLELMGRFGSSHGWVASLNIRDATTMSLQDGLNPVSASSQKPILLPPLTTLPYCQTQLVTNVAMSSSPEQDDCVVAVKFWGPQLSLCRPSCSSKWVNIRTSDSFFTSHVTYSRRDQMFCLPASGGLYTGSWDLHEHRHNPKLNQLLFCNLPKLMQSEWELLDSCFRREDLVEYYPTNESFLVKWYSGSSGNSAKVETKRFMVFEIDEERNACYTEDIGDLCIFLSKSESFCLPASLYPGLAPNSVYFVGVEDTGVCNLATSTIHPYNLPSTAPFWLKN